MSTVVTKSNNLRIKLESMTEEQRKRYLLRVIPCIKGQIRRNQDLYNILSEYEKGV